MPELISLEEAAAMINKSTVYTRFLISFFEIPCEVINGKLMLNRSVFVSVMRAHGFEPQDNAQLSKKKRKKT